VNPGAVDVKISFKNPKTPRKTQKVNNLLSMKNIKMQAKGSLTFHLTCQGAARPPCPPSVTSLSNLCVISIRNFGIF